MQERDKKNIRKQNIISACILVFGTMFSLLIFGPEHSQSQEGQSEQAPAALVSTIIAGQKETKIAILEKTATFSSGEEADVVAEYSGRITEVSFEVGAYVKEGQVLACFDQSRNENSPKINLEAAQRSFQIANENFIQTEKLNKENLELAKNARKIAEIQLKQEKDAKTPEDDSSRIKIAERNLENAKDLEDQAEKQANISLNNARLQVSQTKAGLENAKIAFEKTLIKAPISGLVTSKTVEEGAYVQAGSLVAMITGGGKLQTTISLSSSQIERIKSGDDVEIFIDGEKYSGEIVSFSPVAKNQNERHDVLIKTTNDLSGQANRSGKVLLTLYLDEKREDVFFVPLEAVNIGQKKTIVFVVEAQKAVGREVATGEVIGTQIEIVEGISEGEEVIVENSRNIQEGQTIERNQ